MGAGHPPLSQVNWTACTNSSISSRQRGLFPLPCENDVKQLPGRLSRECRQRAGQRRELSTRASEMACALNSLHGVEDFFAATRSGPAQEETRRILYRAAEAISPPVSRDPPWEALRALLRTSAVYDDGTNTTYYRAELLALLDSSVQATHVHDLVRREDSEYLLGFKEKILLSSEEFNETVGSEALLGFTSIRLSNGQVFTDASSEDLFRWEW